MEERIYPKTIRGKVYYYLQYTYRQKMNSGDKSRGKGPWSGKSQVRTHSEYLGTAAQIRRRLKESKSKCIEARHQDFGMPAAAYQVACKIGLVDVLKKRIQGKRFGIPRYLFFLLAILNRIDNATSKEKMGEWAADTILPQLLQFDHKKLNSKTFWYVTDDILSEKQLQEARKEYGDDDDIFVHLDDSLLCRIETELFANIRDVFEVNPECFFYDTTNFFTYIQTRTPSEYAETGHNKAGRHYLKQVGLAVAVESEYGLPFFHRVYRGNSHDSPTFLLVIDELINQTNDTFGNVNEMFLVLDKGNNSKDNFEKLAGKVRWIGSLVPSNYMDLVQKPLDAYTESWRGLKYFCTKRKVMGRDCILIMTYNSKLFRKRKYSLERGMQKCRKAIQKKFDSYKKPLKNTVAKGMATLKKENRYGKFIEMEVKEGNLYFCSNETEIEKAEIRMGKNLLFSNCLNADATMIIDKYKEKDAIEQGFHLLKDPDMIRQQPFRHWTDTKIRAYCFCCVCALLLLKVMLLISKEAGMEMSPAVLKQELKDLKWIRMIYESLGTETIVSAKSTVQKMLWKLFNLGEIEKMLTIHS